MKTDEKLIKQIQDTMWDIEETSLSKIELNKIVRDIFYEIEKIKKCENCKHWQKDLHKRSDNIGYCIYFNYRGKDFSCRYFELEKELNE